MISSTMDCHCQESVPHRWHVLGILRAMRAGHPFICLPGASCFTYLEGAPLAVHFFGFLERNGYIKPHTKEGLQAHYYTLTSAGLLLHEAGERWWSSLRWRQKLLVMLRG